MGEPATAISTAGVAAIGKLFGLTHAGIAAGIVAIVLLPPQNKIHSAGILLVTVLSSVYVGPFVVTMLNGEAWDQSTKIGVAFLVGVPAFVVLSVLVRAIDRLRGKSLGEILDEIKKIRE